VNGRRIWALLRAANCYLALEVESAVHLLTLSIWWLHASLGQLRNARHRPQRPLYSSQKLS
jgi:hypothetical protein